MEVNIVRDSVILSLNNILVAGEYREVDGTVVRHGAGVYYCSASQTTYNGQWDTDRMFGKGFSANMFS